MADTHVTLSGNLTDDPDLRFTPNGTAVAIAGRVVLRVGQRMSQRRERTGRLPSPARRPWLVGRPLPSRGRR